MALLKISTVLLKQQPELIYLLTIMLASIEFREHESIDVDIYDIQAESLPTDDIVVCATIEKYSNDLNNIIVSFTI